MTRLLVTTAIEETWSYAEPVLFLGEWCRLFERRAHWSALDAEVLPYHWDDREKLEADYAYLSALNKKLVNELGAKLNEIHGVKHSARYWRILVGPWLGYFTQMFYDRWESIRQASEHDLSASIVLTGNETDLVPRDMSDFIRLFLGDAWNHRIYALILRDTVVRLIEKPATESASGSPYDRSTVINSRSGRKGAVKRWLSRVAASLARDNDVFMTNTYLPRGHEVSLYRRFGQAPQHWDAEPAPSADVNWDARTWPLGTDTYSGFEAALRAMIAQQIPTIYLEGYAGLMQHVNTLRWPRSPRLIWTSNSHIADEVFKAWAAGKADAGAPLVIGQHGGHFGVGRWNFLEDHEMAICDRYLSWGWSEPTQPQVVPVGQLKAKRPLKVDHASQSNAMLVTCEVPRYSYWMYSIVVAGQYLNYLEDQYAFIDALPANIREQIVVRLYHTNWAAPAWSHGARMRKRLDGVRFDDGRSPIDDLIGRSRMYISTYNATTFLESMTMNVPTVIFWNPKFWELRDSATPYFEDLRRVGVFHDTPASAARHVAAVWDDVNGWWNHPEVRESVRRFMARYTSLPDDLLDRVKHALLDTTRMPGERS